MNPLDYAIPSEHAAVPDADALAQRQFARLFRAAFPNLTALALRLGEGGLGPPEQLTYCKHGLAAVPPAMWGKSAPPAHHAAAVDPHAPPQFYEQAMAHLYAHPGASYVDSYAAVEQLAAQRAALPPLGAGPQVLTELSPERQEQFHEATKAFLAIFPDVSYEHAYLYVNGHPAPSIDEAVTEYMKRHPDLGYARAREAVEESRRR
jgi:hypothetical protein